MKIQSFSTPEWLIILTQFWEAVVYRIGMDKNWTMRSITLIVSQECQQRNRINYCYHLDGQVYYLAKPYGTDSGNNHQEA